MARKPQRSAKAAPKRAPALPPPSGSDREKIIAAFMALLAEKRFEQIGFGDISARAGVSLATARAEFGSTLSILAAHMKELDRKVLAGGEGDMAEEPPRERLFDVLMRRVEAMAPHREAVRSLMKSAQCNPGLAFALNGLAVRSQTWMLTAAGIGTTGPRGALRAQGAALMFGRVLGVWVDDETPELDRTMVALDRGLASAERWSGFMDDLFCIPALLCRGLPRGRRARNFDRGVEADAA